MLDQTYMHAWSGNAVSDYSAEESSAELCDSGLPDPEVCDVLHIPPKETAVVSEAWSRGYGSPMFMPWCYSAPFPCVFLVHPMHCPADEIF